MYSCRQLYGTTCMYRPLEQWQWNVAILQNRWQNVLLAVAEVVLLGVVSFALKMFSRILNTCCSLQAVPVLWGWFIVHCYIESHDRADHTVYVTLVAEGSSDGQLTHQLTQGLRGGRSEKMVSAVQNMLHGQWMESRDKGTEATGVAGRGSVGSAARL